MKKLVLAALTILVGACSSDSEKIPAREIYANEEDVIVLQQLTTRVLVRCYPSDYHPAEVCARLFEEKGYVRVKDIPHMPAKYDFLKKDTYPTRRWREGENVPRW